MKISEFNANCCINKAIIWKFAIKIPKKKSGLTNLCLSKEFHTITYPDIPKKNHPPIILVCQDRIWSHFLPKWNTLFATVTKLWRLLGSGCRDWEDDDAMIPNVSETTSSGKETTTFTWNTNDMLTNESLRCFFGGKGFCKKDVCLKGHPQ